MLKCKEISELVSESLDRKLPLHVRMEMRLHLMMCHFCRVYRHRTLLLQKILRNYDASLEDASREELCLPEGASARIKKALTETANSAR